MTHTGIAKCHFLHNEDDEIKFVVCKCCLLLLLLLYFLPLCQPYGCLSFNPFPNKPWFFRVCSISLSKTLGEVEIARNEQFLLFPVFSTYLENFAPFSCRLQTLSVWKNLKFVVWERVNGL